MMPRPGTVHTASSANRPRRAKPSLRANASKIRRTSASFSAAATSLLPARDQALDVAPLCVGERDQPEQPAGFARVVVGHCGFEVLTQWCGLTELPAQPTPQAHRRLVGHGCRLTLCAGAESARADSARAKIPKGGRVAAAALLSHVETVAWRARVRRGRQALSASSGSRSLSAS